MNFKSSSSSFPDPNPNPNPLPFSNSQPQRLYDVFINFRGEDTRRKFVSHLYHALSKRAGVKTFVDDENLRMGMRLEDLMRAIEGSQIAIVVFTETFSESTRCLDELAKIIECHETYGQRVLPVFYYIDPSDVFHQKGAFGRLKAAAEKRYPKEHLKYGLSRWSGALTEAKKFDVRNYGSEADLVRKIVNHVLKKLEYEVLSITEFPVGLEAQVQEVIKLIENRSTEVCIIGIWGMGGLGKTTAAKAVYNRIHRTFINKSFIDNIREACETNNRGLVGLQEQLLSDVGKTKVKILSIMMGITMIEKRLAGKRALIVLDDVDEFHQLEALCGNRILMGQGSVIIITTRNRNLLDRLEVDYVYEMDKMNENESLELFCLHAFGKAKPKEDFNEHARNAVSYCDGLPLALEVLGSYLSKRTANEWRSVLSTLEIVPDAQVQKILRISFDSLRDQMEKDIFLDVCCFFIHKDRDYVTEILNGCGLHANIGIEILIERSLIKVDKNNKLGMHNLLRDMGRDIVRESSRKEPGKHSRLWFHEDVVEVLSKNSGTEAVEGLTLKLHFTNRDCIKAETFEKMHRLRLLQFEHVQLAGDYGSLSKKLRWICWRGFPSKYIPNNFRMDGVIAIDIKRSNLKLVWNEPQDLERLKFLNLSHSKYLTETPDFSKLPNLEKLILKDCPRLCKVHESIGDLRNLLLINLKDCISLRNLPREIYKLTSLKTLNLSGCLKIGKLEEDIVQMESLTTLIAKNTAVKQVPFSVVRSKSIRYISLCGYQGLSRNVFPSIIWYSMSPRVNSRSLIHPFIGTLLPSRFSTSILGDVIPTHSNLSLLRRDLAPFDSKFQLAERVRTFPDDIYDVNISDLEITAYTSEDSQLSKHSLSSCLIGIGNYQEVFETLSKSINEGLATRESCDVFLPGDNYPYWLACKGEGHSVCFIVPEGCRLKGMILCVVYLSAPENMANECLTSVVIYNRTRKSIIIGNVERIISFNDQYWKGIMSSLGSEDTVEIFVTFEHGLVVRKTVVYLICDESIDMEMEPSLEPKKNAFITTIKKNLIVAFGLFLLFSFRSLVTNKSSLSHS